MQHRANLQPGRPGNAIYELTRIATALNFDANSKNADGSPTHEAQILNLLGAFAQRNLHHSRRLTSLYRPKDDGKTPLLPDRRSHQLSIDHLNKLSLELLTLNTTLRRAQGIAPGSHASQSADKRTLDQALAQAIEGQKQNYDASLVARVGNQEFNTYSQANTLHKRLTNHRIRMQNQFSTTRRFADKVFGTRGNDTLQAMTNLMTDVANKKGTFSLKEAKSMFAGNALWILGLPTASDERLKQVLFTEFGVRLKGTNELGFKINQDGDMLINTSKLDEAYADALQAIGVSLGNEDLARTPKEDAGLQTLVRIQGWVGALIKLSHQRGCELAIPRERVADFLSVLNGVLPSNEIAKKVKQSWDALDQGNPMPEKQTDIQADPSTALWSGLDTAPEPNRSIMADSIKIGQQAKALTDSVFHTNMHLYLAFEPRLAADYARPGAALGNIDYARLALPQADLRATLAKLDLYRNERKERFNQSTKTPDQIFHLLPEFRARIAPALYYSVETSGFNNTNPNTAFGEASFYDESNTQQRKGIIKTWEHKVNSSATQFYQRTPPVTAAQTQAVFNQLKAAFPAVDLLQTAIGEAEQQIAAQGNPSALLQTVGKLALPLFAAHQVGELKLEPSQSQALQQFMALHLQHENFKQALFTPTTQYTHEFDSINNLLQPNAILKLNQAIPGVRATHNPYNPIQNAIANNPGLETKLKTLEGPVTLTLDLQPELKQLLTELNARGFDITQVQQDLAAGKGSEIKLKDHNNPRSLYVESDTKAGQHNMVPVQISTQKTVDKSKLITSLTPHILLANEEELNASVPDQTLLFNYQGATLNPQALTPPGQGLDQPGQGLDRPKQPTLTEAILINHHQPEKRLGSLQQDTKTLANDSVNVTITPTVERIQLPRDEIGTTQKISEVDSSANPLA